MAVAVIGGAGFIGSNLVDELMTQGFEVTVLDNLSQGSLSNIQRWKGNQKLEFVRGDVKDRDLVRRVCDHKDWVFHMAAMSRVQPSVENPHSAFEDNVIGTLNVLEACRHGEVKRLIYSASSAGYKTNEFGTPYALSKKFGEEMAVLYNRLYGLSTVSLRYFNVYGPRHPETGAYSTVIGIFRGQVRREEPITITGDGEQRRDFVFVGDVVRANMMAAMNYDVTGSFNIGFGKNYSINEIANAIAPGHEKKYIQARPGEDRETLADISETVEKLGWKPTVDLAWGLEITEAFERRQGSSLIITG